MSRVRLLSKTRPVPADRPFTGRSSGSWRAPASSPAAGSAPRSGSPCRSPTSGRTRRPRPASPLTVTLVAVANACASVIFGRQVGDDRHADAPGRAVALVTAARAPACRPASARSGRRGRRAGASRPGRPGRAVPGRGVRRSGCTPPTGPVSPEHGPEPPRVRTPHDCDLASRRAATARGDPWPVRFLGSDPARTSTRSPTPGWSRISRRRRASVATSRKGRGAGRKGVRRGRDTRSDRSLLRSAPVAGAGRLAGGTGARGGAGGRVRRAAGQQADRVRSPVDRDARPGGPGVRLGGGRRRQGGVRRAGRSDARRLPAGADRARAGARARADPRAGRPDRLLHGPPAPRRRSSIRRGRPGSRSRSRPSWRRRPMRPAPR